MRDRWRILTTCFSIRMKQRKNRWFTKVALIKRVLMRMLCSQGKWSQTKIDWKFFYDPLQFLRRVIRTSRSFFFCSVNLVEHSKKEMERKGQYKIEDEELTQQIWWYDLIQYESYLYRSPDHTLYITLHQLRRAQQGSGNKPKAFCGRTWCT